MKSKRSWALSGLFAVALALLPLAFPGCTDPTPPAPTPTPNPAPSKVTKSARPIAGEIRAYGWSRPAKPAAPSTRYRLKMAQPFAALPASVDLRPKDVPIYNQGSLGSCTAHGWAAAVEYRDKQIKVTPANPGALDRVLIYFWLKSPPAPTPASYFMPSRLFIYYGERALEGTINSDSGAAVADGGRVVSTLGTPPETDWPYNIGRFAQKPPAQAYADAKKHVAPTPSSIDNSDMDEVKTALANGHPIVFGFDVHSSFESIGSGGVYMPAGGIVGGHCVAAVGYDDAKQMVIVRNSWGTDWGAQGYFYFPYRYFTSSMVSDAWTLAN